MKKFVILILSLFLFVSIPVFAIYKPIPQNYIKQYKKEINKVIKEQIQISKKEINTIFFEVETEQNAYIKMYTIDQGINCILFELYMKLIDTTDKYVNIKQDIPETDWYGDLKNIMTPYLEKNNINSKKINSFLKYAHKKQLELQKNTIIKMSKNIF